MAEALIIWQSIVFIICLVLLFLLILMPYFVYRIHVRADQLFEASKNLQILIAWQKALYEEQAKTNYYLHHMTHGNSNDNLGEKDSIS
jgi:hypothetical protein